VSVSNKDERPVLPPTGSQRDVSASALAARKLRKASLAASLMLHAGVLVALVLIALWGLSPPSEAPAIRVTLLSEGPGAAGASGGDAGGGGTTEASSAPAAASAEVATAAPPEPATASSEQQAVAPEQQAAAPEPAAVAPEPPAAAPLPAPPRRKPAPPRPAPAVAASPPPAPEPEQLAAAAAPPAPGAAGIGSGPGGAVGRATGAEGAGHGAIGDGPIKGPGDDYLDRLRRWLDKYKRYPEQAKKDKQQGQLVVSFTILRDGTVRDPRIERSSGFPLLDEAALAMLRDASPVPPLPPSFRPSAATIDLPVNFELGFFTRTF
jgi:periplasmic protein TonB